MFVEPGASTGRAGLGELILSQEDADVLLVALLFEPFEKRKDPDVSAHFAVKQLAPHRGLEPAPRRSGISAELARRIVEQFAAGLVARLGPGVDRPVQQALA